jgi:hypothetical protein
LSVLVTVTLAPAIAAPVGSLTEPTMALVVSPWAHAGSGDKAEMANAIKSGKTTLLLPIFRHA